MANKGKDSGPAKRRPINVHERLAGSLAKLRETMESIKTVTEGEKEQEETAPKAEGGAKEPK